MVFCYYEDMLRRYQVLFINVLKRDWHTFKLIHAKQEQTLPPILTIKETWNIINSVKTIQGKTYLTFVYTCGLLLHEALFLQVTDIDSERTRIHVHRGNRSKDRFVPLPKATLNCLRQYWLTHRNLKFIFLQIKHGLQDKSKTTSSEHLFCWLILWTVYPEDTFICSPDKHSIFTLI
jgi:integrase